jgi:hypothetical protein
MSSSDAEPVRVTRRGHRFIKEAKDSWYRVGTIQGFAERAVTDNLGYFQRNLRGTDGIRDLCERLSDVNGIELDIPEHNPTARLVQQNLDRRVLVELDAENKERLSDVRDCTELDRSKIIRLCLVKQLYELVREENLFEYPKGETIEDAWLPAKKAIDSTFPRMVYELHLQGVEQEEFLRSRIKRDQHSGRRLQGYYKNHFCHTAGYDRMRGDELGAETLNSLESVLATAVGQHNQEIP